MLLRAHRTLTTSTPPDQVFAFLADFRNAEKWDPGTVSCELLEGDLGVGSTYRNVSQFLGRKTEVTYTTLERQDGRRLHFRGRNDNFTGNDRLSVSPVGGGTEVTYDADFEFHGLAQVVIPLVAAYMPLLANKTVKQLADTLDALRA
jgi:carbon monoxide dehydrogenase subunit G